MPLVVLLCAAGFAAAGVTVAAPLAKDACDALKSEQVALIGTGLRAEMARGAVWAQGNLAPDRLKKIARLIEVDEQILFRCPGSPPENEAAAKPAPTPPVAKQAKPAPGDSARTKVTAGAKATGGAKVTGAKAGDGAAVAAPGGKLEPQSGHGPGAASANATANASGSAAEKPKKPTKAGAAAEKKRTTAAAKAQARSKPGDAFISPPGTPHSTLQAPAAAEKPKAQ